MMKLLPHSNGVHKVDMKKKRSPKEKFKIIFIIIISILVIGVVFQTVRGFIAKETLKQKLDYTVVNDKRMDYRLTGEGQYTLVFDGEIGNNLEAWNAVIAKLNPKNVSAFVYNRRGYGYSDGGGRQTPEEQAKELKILLRKSGAVEPYILVGEQYGSLVLTSFAKQFPDYVSGVVLIDPLKESELGTSEFKKENLVTRIRRSIENFGSSFGFTTILRQIGLDVKLNDFEKSLDNEQLHEFSIQRTSQKYTTSVKNELTTLCKGVTDIQNEGVFKDKPYYLLSNEENNPLVKLGDQNVTKTFITDKANGNLAINDTDNIINGINYVIKILQDREKAQKKVS